MTRTRQWNPLQGIDAFATLFGLGPAGGSPESRQVNRMFRGTPFRLPTHPAVNVSVSEDDVVVSAELPGLDADDLDLTVVRDSVTIRGERKADDLPEGESWLRRERPTGAFERTVTLPFEVDSQSAEATFENGVLRLVLHRPEELKPRKVAVNVKK